MQRSILLNDLSIIETILMERLNKKDTPTYLKLKIYDALIDIRKYRICFSESKLLTDVYLEQIEDLQKELLKISATHIK